MKDLPGLKSQQILKACNALLKHVAKQKVASTDLLEEDEIIYLVQAFRASIVTQHEVFGREERLARLVWHTTGHGKAEFNCLVQTIALLKTPTNEHKDKPIKL